MLQAIGHILPIALAVAISSVPIMATIVILLSPERSQTAMPLLIGWVLGIAVVVSVCTLGAQLMPTPRSPRQTGDGDRRSPRSSSALALVVMAIMEWRRGAARTHRTPCRSG